MRPKLFTDAEFQLDPDSSLRYLNFKEGRCWDRETEAWTRTRPEMLISRSTGWEFEECTNPATQKVGKALAPPPAFGSARRRSENPGGSCG